MNINKYEQIYLWVLFSGTIRNQYFLSPTFSVAILQTTLQETEARRLAEELLGGYRGRESLGRGDTRLDIREIEREACEGQEQGEASLGPPPGTSVTSPLPLDQLLAQADLPGGCMYSLTMFLVNLTEASS